MIAVLLGAALIAGVAGYAVAGPAGLFSVAGLAAACALLAARLRLPAPLPRGARPRRTRFGAPAFGRYGQIELALAEAQTSRRHFDHVTRPLLHRLLAALLADRRGIDLAGNRAAARAALGERLWPLLDPGRPACNDSDVPGVDVGVLTDIVDRLEGL
jgi:hypothetical protein